MATCFFQGTRMAGITVGMLLLLAGPISGAGPVNINTADAATLSRELKGIGAKRAQAIIDYRKAHGPFRSADELALVKGIGPAAINKNRADIRVEVPNNAQGPQGKSKCAPGTCGATVKSNTIDR